MASLGVLPPDVEPKATEHIPQMIALIERLIAKGAGLRGGRRRLLRGAEVSALRAAVGQEPGRSPGGGAGGGGRAQARPARLRAVEIRQAGRAFLAEPVGTGPARLAHRVLGHGQPAPRRDPRHPRRRRGPHLPASRVRDRAVRGRHRQALRALLGAQRAAQPGRGEDVEVAGQYAVHPRAGQAPRSGGHPDLSPRRALPAPVRLQRRAHRGVGARAGAAARAGDGGGAARRARHAAARTGPGALRRGGPRARALRGGDGRRLQHPAGAGRALRPRPDAPGRAHRGDRRPGGRGRLPGGGG